MEIFSALRNVDQYQLYNLDQSFSYTVGEEGTNPFSPSYSQYLLIPLVTMNSSPDHYIKARLRVSNTNTTINLVSFQFTDVSRLCLLHLCIEEGSRRASVKFKNRKSENYIVMDFAGLFKLLPFLPDTTQIGDNVLYKPQHSSHYLFAKLLLKPIPVIIKYLSNCSGANKHRGNTGLI